MPFTKQTHLATYPAIDQISAQGNSFIENIELIGENNSTLLIPLLNRAGHEVKEDVSSHWTIPIIAMLESNPATTKDFQRILSDISRAEYFFLESTFLEMITQVHQLRAEMKEIYSINEPQVKDLKRELKLLTESLFKMTSNASQGISIREIKTSERISAIQYELNRLQNSKTYNLLSDIKAHARVLPTNRLENSALSNLTSLGIIQVARFPFDLKKILNKSDQNDLRPVDGTAVGENIQYCYSESGLKFIEACTGQIL